MHRCLIIRNLRGAHWEEGALLWGALTEKGVLYKPTESKEKRGEEY